MLFTHQGLSLWYDTADAPAPADGASDTGVTLTLGVRPPNVANRVSVHYRVDGGLVRTLAARELAATRACSATTQYFRADFPRLPGAQRVEYSPVLCSAGRQLPPPPLERRFPSSFRVTTPEAPAPSRPELHAEDPSPFPAALEHMSRIEAQLSAEPEVVGETPDGYRINFFIEGGRMHGPKLRGHVRKRGQDSMLIRRDGVGMIRVRAVLETHDGALIDADYTGLIELGPDGYARALAGVFPELPSIRLAPRLRTGHPSYQWLNRSQFLGVGRVIMTRRLVQYDLLAIRSQD